MSGEVTYGSYLNLSRLLGAQNPPGPDGKPRAWNHHDEMLFVVIHQVYELWFKQVLHELRLTRDLLAKDPVPEEEVERVVKALGRIVEIEKVLVQQLTVLETMSPVDFLAFRGELGSASGFQSAQFRELEILAGLPDDARFEYEGQSFERRFPPATVERFARLREEEHLRAVLERWLERTPVEEDFVDRYLDAFDRYVDEQAALHRDNEQLTDEERGRVTERLETYRKDCRAFLTGERGPVHAACLFIQTYREAPLLHWPHRLLEALLEFEEWLRLWRFRHARMVERMIGLRVGTGGSSGVGYLDATSGDRYRLFHVILRSRTFLIPRRLLAGLRAPADYGFHRDATGPAPGH